MTADRQPPPPPEPSPLGDYPRAKSTDNPIAVAGIVVSLLGLIMSMIVVGGFIGLVGIVLSGIGLQRSKLLGGRGKGAAVGGIALGLLSILASAGFAFLIFTQAGGGREATTLNGIETHSSNTEFPPQDDLVAFECEQSGSSARATIELENLSPGPSVYIVTVQWDTTGGNTVDDSVQSEIIEPGDTVTLRLIDVTGNADAESCNVTTIERTGLAFLNGN